jgi:hypothetical protein
MKGTLVKLRVVAEAGQVEDISGMIAVKLADMGMDVFEVSRAKVLNPPDDDKARVYVVARLPLEEGAG